MDDLWTLDPGQTRTVREVHAAIAAERDVAYTTVMTVMDRLAKKDLVVQEKAGRAYRYRAASTRSEMTAELMHRTLEGVGDDDRRSALVSFVADADEADLAALRDALARVEGGAPAAAPGVATPSDDDGGAPASGGTPSWAV